MQPSRLPITLVELPATTDGRLFGPGARDIYSLMALPPRGIPQLEAVLRAAGFSNVVSLCPAFTSSRRHLRPQDMRRLFESSLVGLSLITRTAPQSYELANLIRQRNPRACVVIGGPHPTALPEEALGYGDVVVLHEGDKTVVEVAERVADSPETPDWTGVAGIAYHGADGRLTFGPERPFLNSHELSALPFPVYSPDVLAGMTHHVVNTARGCPFECEFCSVIENFGRQFRFLDDDSSVALIRYTLSLGRKHIFFGDDIFTANRARIKRILDRLLTEGERMPSWSAQVRVESAQDRELLRLMRRAGCTHVYLGLESVNPEALVLYNKRATVEKNRQAVRAYHAAGIRVHGMFVLGSDADSLQTVQETLEFALLERLDTVQFFALTPVPGPPLTRRLEEEGRVLSHAWHLFDAQHVVVQPAKMGAYELQKAILDASLAFYSYRQALHRLLKGPDRLYNSAIRVRGRHLGKRIARDSAGHLRWLAQLEGHPVNGKG